MSMYAIFIILLQNYEKLYMLTIISSPGRVCVSIILFQLSDSKAWLFESNLLWVVQYDPPPTPHPSSFHIGKRTLKKKKTLWPLFMDGVQLPQG